MNNYLKVGFLFLLLAVNIFLTWLNRHNNALQRESFYRLTNGSVSNFKPKNRIHLFYKSAAGHYEAELNERTHKKANLDSMWNALHDALTKATSIEEATYYAVKWSDAKSPAEKAMAELTPVTRASDELDSIVSSLKQKYTSNFPTARVVNMDPAKNYFHKPINISKAHQAALWIKFQQYSESVSTLLENSLLKRKVHLDSVWIELNRIAATSSSAQLAKGVPWPQSIPWNFLYLYKTNKISATDLHYLIPKIKPFAESGKLMKLRNEFARINALFAGTGKFQLYKKIYSLDNITASEFHSVLKAILITKDLTDDALISCYEESVRL
jgi:hypothetical protein